MIGIVKRRIQRTAERRPEGDEGTTLMELIVGMTIMVIFMTMFTTAIYLMTTSSNKVEALSITNSQTAQAFLKLDKTVRYASAITTPAISTTAGGTGDWYVELDTTNTGTEVCTQMRVDKTASQLQMRTWTVPSSGTPTPSGWSAMASYITNGSAANGSSNVPFVLLTPASSASASTSFQQLQITLVSTAGNGTTATTRSQMSFTAINSSVSATNNNSVCQQVGRP